MKVRVCILWTGRDAIACEYKTYPRTGNASRELQYRIMGGSED